MSNLVGELRLQIINLEATNRSHAESFGRKEQQLDVANARIAELEAERGEAIDRGAFLLLEMRKIVDKIQERVEIFEDVVGDINWATNSDGDFFRLLWDKVCELGEAEESKGEPS